MKALLLMAAVLLVAAEPAAPDVAKLIARLGSPRFVEREQASRALERLGVDAFEALVKASEGPADGEVRRRAVFLLARLKARSGPSLAGRIVRSGLSPTAKGRWLSRFIEPGMTSKQVRAMLGRPDCAFHSGGCTGYIYSDLGLVVCYGRDSLVEHAYPE